jgi:DNA-binding transcriptional ArsR family regulator
MPRSPHHPLEESAVGDVARVFADLGEPTRLTILQHLGQGPLYVSELVERVGGKQANVSKQLGILHQAGLVGRERDGIQVRYFIADPMIFDLCDLVCGKLRREAEARIQALPSPARRSRGR